MCTVPAIVPPGRDLTMRCALKPGLNAKVVQLHHRAAGVEAFQVLPMRKTAKGWYLATLPGHTLTEGSLQVYFDARDASDREVASNGHIDSPSIIAVRRGSAGRHGGGGDEDDPLNRIRNQQRDEAYESGLHRRREGAIWIGVGGGAGWGYSPAGKLEWESKVQVSAITTTTGMFHLLPEFGWMYSDTFALALQARVEFIKQQQGTWKDPDTGAIQLITPTWINGAPTTMAIAVFGRAIRYADLSRSGNLQFSYSADLGGGFIRFPVLPSQLRDKSDLNYNASTSTYEPRQDRAIAKTDTRPVGPFLFGATGGFIYHFSRHFAVALDLRFLSGLPAFGAVIEGGLSLQLGLGGAKGAAKVNDDEDEAEFGGPGLDSPDSGSSDEEEEEE